MLEYTATKLYIYVLQDDHFTATNPCVNNQLAFGNYQLSIFHKNIHRIQFQLLKARQIYTPKMVDKYVCANTNLQTC